MAGDRSTACLLYTSPHWSGRIGGRGQGQGGTAPGHGLLLFQAHRFRGTLSSRSGAKHDKHVHQLVGTVPQKEMCIRDRYEAMGLDLDFSTEEGFYNYYSTRYLIWANEGVATPEKLESAF